MAQLKDTVVSGNLRVTDTILTDSLKINGGTSSQFLKADGSVDTNTYALASAVPSAVTESTVSGWGFTKNTGTYSKPSNGIPASDLANDVIPYVENFYFVQGSSSQAGNATSGSYLSTKWEGTIPGVSTAVNGLKIAYRIATNTGVSTAGVVLSIDGINYYPVVIQTNTIVTTHYPVGTTVLMVFNSTQTATAYLTSNTKSTVTGCWQIMEYDSNTNTYQRVYLSSNDVEYPITTRYNITSGSAYYAEYGRYSEGVTLNPSTNTITAGSFKIANGTSSQFLKADGSIDSNTYALASSVPTAVTESTVSGWGFTKNAGTYSKPSGGIPATDLASAVQTSLGKADTALQSFTEADPVFSASAAAGITASDITNWNGKTSNTGTLTGVKFNNTNATVTNGVASITATIPAAPGTLNTTATAAQTTSSSEALSGSITLHKVAKTGTYSDLIGTPTIPAAPGTLKTNNTTAQTTNASEALSGTINLHQVSKTGNYYDLLNKPRIFTGTCTIAAGTQAKTVTCANYDALTKGDIVFVTFSNTNTHATPTLNVNSKGAKSIKAIVNGALVNLPNPGALYANETIAFQYDGTYWVAMNTDTNPENELPSYSTSNNGQILSVVNGALAWVTPAQIYSGSGTPSNSTGNNGDIYVQS